MDVDVVVIWWIYRISSADGDARVAVLEAFEIGVLTPGAMSFASMRACWGMRHIFTIMLRQAFGERPIELLGHGPQPGRRWKRRGCRAPQAFDMIEKHDIECEPERASTLRSSFESSRLEVIEAGASVAVLPPRPHCRGNEQERWR